MTETSGREKVLEDALRITRQKLCIYCADGVPFFDDSDGLDRKKLYHRRHGSAGLIKCVAAEATEALRALASPFTQEPALRGGKVEEIGLVEWSQNAGHVSLFEAAASQERSKFVPPPLRTKPSALSDRLEEAAKRYSEIDEDGTFAELRSLCVEAAAALRTHAAESAAQSERAGLERAAELAERYPDTPSLVDFAKQLRALSAARKAGGE